MTFQRGMGSPNPGGRPKTARYAAAARELLASPGQEAPAEWGEASAFSKAQRGVLADYQSWLQGDAQAAARILDRAEGRPASVIELGGAIGLERLPEGVPPEGFAAIRRDPDAFLAAHIGLLLTRAEEGGGEGLLGRVFSDPRQRARARLLLDRAEAKEQALLSTTVPEPADGQS